MRLEKVICIEDSIIKYMSIYRFLEREQIKDVYHARNAEEGIEAIERAVSDGVPYDLLLSDMHFDFYGIDDRMAGEKTLKLLREKGINIPVVICSSQNWSIPGTVGSIFYNERRDWEQEAQELFRDLREL